MANTNLLSNFYRFQQANNLMGSVASNSYYFFVGDHVPHANQTLQTLNDDSNDNFLAPYTKMIMGKEIKIEDVLPVIRDVPWSSMIFDMYDNNDINLSIENFYCTVNEGFYYHVWKCLDNNNRSISTVQPSFAAGSTSTLYQTSDGYRWQYMTSVDSVTVHKFQTATYFPLIANSQVSANAKNGFISIIKVVANQQGEFYNNYIDGILKTGDLQVNGDPTLFNISNTAVQAVNGYYTGCVISLTSGTGQGQFKVITDFVSNTTGNILRVANTFVITPQNGTTYQIRPQVNVVSNGQETINCVARALVNSLSSNSIYRVEVLQYGAGIVNATASVVANAIVGVPNNEIAVVQPIIGPYGGHGFDIFNELFCHDVEFAVQLANTEGNTLPTLNQYQQIGIIQNPLFQNVELTLTFVTGLFSFADALMIVDPIQLNTNCTCNANSTFISSNNANFFLQTPPNTQIIVTSGTGLVNQLLTINSLVNTTLITTTTNSTFTSNNATLYLSNIFANCVINSITNSTVMVLSSCPPLLTTGSTVMGSQSGAQGTVMSIKRNGIIKDFSTFIGMYKYTATQIAGTFIINEKILQGNNSGFVHHVEGTGTITIFLSIMTPSLFVVGQQITGVTSGATATLNTVFSPEVIFGSGPVQYIENVAPITRANQQSEAFQIVMNF